MADKERLEEIKEAYRLSHKEIGAYVNSEGIEYLIQQAERVEELENNLNGTLYTHNLQAERIQKLERELEESEKQCDFTSDEYDKVAIQNKELEYASRYNGALNEFLQKRKLPPSKLGRHVVDVVMEYVEELEKLNNHHEDRMKDYHLQAVRNGMEIERLHEENQRYKQVLEDLLYSDDAEVVRVVTEALKGRSESK